MFIAFVFGFLMFIAFGLGLFIGVSSGYQILIILSYIVAFISGGLSACILFSNKFDTWLALKIFRRRVKNV